MKREMLFVILSFLLISCMEKNKIKYIEKNNYENSQEMIIDSINYSKNRFCVLFVCNTYKPFYTNDIIYENLVKYKYKYNRNIELTDIKFKKKKYSLFIFSYDFINLKANIAYEK